MLLELRVQNFAIIDNINVHFSGGLNIISGETGAGKSIILKSLALLMGEKANPDMVKSDCETAFIEGLFELHGRDDINEKLHQMGFNNEEDQLIVRRVISAHGKSRVYINDSLSTLHVLKNLVSPLIEISGPAIPLLELTGQFENRNLQSKQYHLDMIDQYTSSLQLRNDYNELYEKIRNIKLEIQNFEFKKREEKQRLDFLLFQKNEISTINPQIDEDKKLSRDIKLHKVSKKTLDFIHNLETQLYSMDSSAIHKIHSLFQQAEDIVNMNPTIEKKLESLKQAQVLIEDCVYELRTYSNKINIDGDALNEYEERLSKIRKLQKKHGPEVSDILNKFKNINDEIHKLESSSEDLDQLKKQLKLTELNAKNLAEDLHKRRVNGSQLLDHAVNKELLDLNMKGTQLEVQINKLNQLQKNGITELEFMLRSSSADQPKPIGKFASGGELSRILLSLKKVCGTSERPRTYLFDEVDSGVSGKTAEKVGLKLKDISHNQQVICVTHLPQVAAHSDSHYLITKSPAGKSIDFEISKLDEEKKVTEIARLISGEKITKTSLEHAQQLLKH